MLFGVYFYSLFITSLGSSTDSNDNKEKGSEYMKHKIEYIRYKYMVRGRANINLDMLIQKSINEKLLEEYNLINDLPKDKRIIVFEQIHSYMSNSIKFFGYFELEIFLKFYKNLNLKGFSKSENVSIK